MGVCEMCCSREKRHAVFKRARLTIGRQQPDAHFRGLGRWHLRSLGGLVYCLCGFDDGAEELLPVSDDAIAGITKYIGVAVFVDGDDALGTRATGNMLARTRNTDCDIDVWGDGLASEANLPAIRYPARVHCGTRSADTSPQSIR